MCTVGSILSIFLFLSANLIEAVVIIKNGNKGLKYRGRFFDNIPEEHLNVSQIIQYHGYPCENHEVLTTDGYILSLQRISHGRKQITPKHHAVFLQHGLLDSAATWVVNKPEESLGFILADHGYDVWLGNSRGNTYSNKHINLTNNDAKFWDFTFDDLAMHDLPASVDYILKTTKTMQLTYVGHSQGTMMGFAEFGRNKELSKKIKTFIALAPVATIKHVKGAFSVLSKMAPEVEFLFKILGVKRFLPNSWLMKLMADVVCATHITEKFCASFIFLMCGFDTSNLNNTRIPVYISHTPAGTSTKNIIHFAQMIKSGKFEMFDYGKHNIEHYMQNYPPSYNISAVETPIALFLSKNDWLADPADYNANLIPHLPNIVFQQELDEYNHLDFLWSVDANARVYANILKLLEKYPVH